MHPLTLVLESVCKCFVFIFGFRSFLVFLKNLLGRLGKVELEVKFKFPYLDSGAVHLSHDTKLTLSKVHCDRVQYFTVFPSPYKMIK